MKLQNSGIQFWLTVPKDIMDANGWKKGDDFLPIPIENGIQYTKIDKK